MILKKNNKGRAKNRSHQIMNLYYGIILYCAILSLEVIQNIDRAAITLMRHMSAMYERSREHSICRNLKKNFRGKYFIDFSVRRHEIFLEKNDRGFAC